jgi:hypothetical protein
MAADRRDSKRGSLLAVVKPTTPRTLAERGRVYYAEDVIELLASSGRTVTRWWCNHHFAPEHCFKVGRANAWWEADVLAWLDNQQRDKVRRRG